MPSSAKDLEQARYLANRLQKRDRHLGRQARRAGSDCYRVYDRDIPEIPLAVDRYGAAAVAYLYERPYDKPEADEAEWLSLMADAVAESLRVPRAEVRVKTRRRLGLAEQYAPGGGVESSGRGVRGGGSGLIADRRTAEGTSADELVVAEQGLSFIVDLGGYIDTGLFMDHRLSRAMIRRQSEGKRVLNLFCYTGAFSVYALAGGASEVVGVDLSKAYLAWADRNVALNGLDAARYRGERADATAWLAAAAERGERFDLIVLDPPTFSNSKRMDGFLDTARHWSGLVRASLSVLADGGFVFFSSNAKSIKVDPAAVPGAHFAELGGLTVPEDFRGHPHRAWIVSREAVNPTRFFPRGPA